MIEYLLDIGSPAGAALFVYFMMNRRIEELKSCVMNKHLTNAKEIEYLKGRLGLG